MSTQRPATGIPSASAEEAALPAVRGWTVVTALLAPAAVLGGYLYAVSATPGFDVIRQPLSDLGAASASTRWTIGIALAVGGFALLGTAVGLRTADMTGRWLLGSGGFMLAAMALEPNHVPGKFTLLHTLFSEFAFILLALWPAMSAHSGPRVPWPLRRWVGIAVSVVVFVLLQIALWGLVLRAESDGIRETLVYAAVTLWPLVVVAWLMARGPGAAYRPVRLEAGGGAGGAAGGAGQPRR